MAKESTRKQTLMIRHYNSVFRSYRILRNVDVATVVRKKEA